MNCNLMHTAVCRNDGPFASLHRGGANSRSGTTRRACSPLGKGESSRNDIRSSPSAPSATRRHGPSPRLRPGSRELAWPTTTWSSSSPSMRRCCGGGDRFRYIITVEEGVKRGLGSAVLEFAANGYQESGGSGRHDDRFVTHGTVRTPRPPVSMRRASWQPSGR